MAKRNGAWLKGMLHQLLVVSCRFNLIVINISETHTVKKYRSGIFFHRIKLSRNYFNDKAEADVSNSAQEALRNYRLKLHPEETVHLSSLILHTRSYVALISSSDEANGSSLNQTNLQKGTTSW